MHTQVIYTTKYRKLTSGQVTEIQQSQCEIQSMHEDSLHKSSDLNRLPKSREEYQHVSIE